MRFLPLLLLFALTAFSFTGDNSHDGLIIPGKKAGPVTLGYTTIETARDSIGITEQVSHYNYIGRHGPRRRHRRHHYDLYGKRHGVWTVGIHYNYYLSDSAKGISMSSSYSRLHVVDEIQLKAPCSWKTAEGIGIGTSFEEIRKLLGEPTYELDSVFNEHRGMSMWHQMDYGKISFRSLHRMDEPGGCCVDLIVINCENSIRPHAGTTYRALFWAKRPPPCTKC